RRAARRARRVWPGDAHPRGGGGGGAGRGERGGPGGGGPKQIPFPRRPGRNPAGQRIRRPERGRLVQRSPRRVNEADRKTNATPIGPPTLRSRFHAIVASPRGSTDCSETLSSGRGSSHQPGPIRA